MTLRHVALSAALVLPACGGPQAPAPQAGASPARGDAGLRAADDARLGVGPTDAVIGDAAAPEEVLLEGAVAGTPDRSPAALPAAPGAVAANGLTAEVLDPRTPCQVVHAALFAYEKTGDLTASGLYGAVKYRQAWCFVAAGDWLNAGRALAKTREIAAGPLPGTTDDYRTALADAARADQLWSLGQRDDLSAAEALEALGELGPEAELGARVEGLVEALRDRGRLAAARDLLAAALERDPALVDPLATRAAILHLSLEAEPEAVPGAACAALAAEVKGARARPDHDPADEAEAEEALRHGALHAATRARRSPEPDRDAALARAISLHRSYLDLFAERPVPGRERYVTFITFYLAELQLEGGEAEEAAATFERVVTALGETDDPRSVSLREQALEGVMVALNEAVEAAERAQPPSLASLERQPIPPLHQRLLDASQRYLDSLGELGAQRVETLYLRARILYTFNHAAEAEAALRAVLAASAAGELACHATHLLLDLINQRGDLAALRDEAAKARAAGAGCNGERLERLAEIEQQAALHLIQRDLEAKGAYDDAAAAYLFFYETQKERLQGRNGIIALHNAAVMLDRAGETEEARSTRQSLVDAFPADDELVKAAAEALAGAGD